MSITTELNAIKGKTTRLLSKCNTSLQAKGSPTVPSLSGLPQAITDIKSGIEPLDHTVTFMVDGNPYEIVSVKNGNSVNAPATEPTSASGGFSGWGQTFPFVPTNDVELNAEFQTVRTEMEVSTAGANLGTLMGTKTTNDIAIYGYGKLHRNSGGSYVVVLLSINQNACKTSTHPNVTASTIYNDVKYWQINDLSSSTTQIVDGSIKPTYVGQNFNSIKDVCKATLDYYFRLI